MISSTFSNEEILQMTALCSEPFVHYCHAKKERGREISDVFLGFRTSKPHTMQNKREVTATQCLYKIRLKKLKMKPREIHREALHSAPYFC